MDFLRSKARSAWVTVMKCVGREDQAQPRGKRLLAKPAESTCTSQKSTVSFNVLRVQSMKIGLDVKSTALLQILIISTDFCLHAHFLIIVGPNPAHTFVHNKCLICKTPNLIGQNIAFNYSPFILLR